MKQEDFFTIMDAAEEQDIADMMTHACLAQFSAEQENIDMQNHQKKRKITWLAVAAAAVLAVGGVTAAGAASDWNMSAVFSNFMQKPAKEPIDYTLFESLGRDINETMDFGDFTITVDSIMADGQVAYIVYEYNTADTAVFQNRTLYEFMPNFHGILIDPEHPEDDSLVTSTRAILELPDKNGVQHGIEELFLKSGETLEGKQIQVSCAQATAAFGKDRDHLTGETMEYPLQTLTFSTDGMMLECLHGQSDFAAKTKLGRGNVKEVSVSALSAALLMEQVEVDRSGVYADLPLDDSVFISGATDDKHAITLIYADGTETVLTGNCDVHNWREANEPVGVLHGNIVISFNRPISIAGLTAVRYDGNEIAVS